MLDGKTSPETVQVTSSVNPTEAGKSLSESGDVFRATGDPSETIQLKMTIDSVITPKVTAVYLVTSGATEVNYKLVYGTSSMASPPMATDPNTETTVSSGELPSPITANQIIVNLKPASSDLPVEVSGFYVVACFEPG